jgi:hypothetical protein
MLDELDVDRNVDSLGGLRGIGVFVMVEGSGIWNASGLGFDPELPFWLLMEEGVTLERGRAGAEATFAGRCMEGVLERCDAGTTLSRSVAEVRGIIT